MQTPRPNPTTDVADDVSHHEFLDLVRDGCPVGVAARILDGKWTTRIGCELLGGKKRFSELQRALNGISPKILTARLNMLVDNGLVTKTIYPCIPPKTEYQLTELGQNLRGVILALAEFGRQVVTCPPTLPHS